MSKYNRWFWCVVGNIVPTHYDKNGVLRYGTSAYTGGTKVYLCGKSWPFDRTEISVLGLTRGKRLQVHEVPVELIENVRAQKVFRPSILEFMSDLEYSACWWKNTREDAQDVREFVALWQKYVSSAAPQTE